MLTQQHLYNGLARFADYSIFAWEWARPPTAIVNGLACCVAGARVVGQRC